jgi:hypothetical protein
VIHYQSVLQKKASILLKLPLIVKVPVVKDTPGDGLPFEIDGLSNGSLTRIEIVY